MPPSTERQDSIPNRSRDVFMLRESAVGDRGVKTCNSVFARQDGDRVHNILRTESTQQAGPGFQVWAPDDLRSRIRARAPSVLRPDVPKDADRRVRRAAASSDKRK